MWYPYAFLCYATVKPFHGLRTGRGSLCKVDGMSHGSRASLVLTLSGPLFHCLWQNFKTDTSDIHFYIIPIYFLFLDAYIHKWMFCWGDRSYISTFHCYFLLCSITCYWRVQVCISLFPSVCIYCGLFFTPDLQGFPPSLSPNAFLINDEWQLWY